MAFTGGAAAAAAATAAALIADTKDPVEAERGAEAAAEAVLQAAARARAAVSVCRSSHGPWTNWWQQGSPKDAPRPLAGLSPVQRSNWSPAEQHPMRPWSAFSTDTTDASGAVQGGTSYASSHGSADMRYDLVQEEVTPVCAEGAIEALAALYPPPQSGDSEDPEGHSSPLGFRDLQSRVQLPCNAWQAVALPRTPPHAEDVGGDVGPGACGTAAEDPGQNELDGSRFRLGSFKIAPAAPDAWEALERGLLYEQEEAEAYKSKFHCLEERCTRAESALADEIAARSEADREIQRLRRRLAPADPVPAPVQASRAASAGDGARVWRSEAVGGYLAPDQGFQSSLVEELMSSMAISYQAEAQECARLASELRDRQDTEASSFDGIQLATRLTEELASEAAEVAALRESHAHVEQALAFSSREAGTARSFEAQAGMDSAEVQCLRDQLSMAEASSERREAELQLERSEVGRLRTELYSQRTLDPHYTHRSAASGDVIWRSAGGSATTCGETSAYRVCEDVTDGEVTGGSSPSNVPSSATSYEPATVVEDLVPAPACEPEADAMELARTLALTLKAELASARASHSRQGEGHRAAGKMQDIARPAAQEKSAARRFQGDVQHCHDSNVPRPRLFWSAPQTPPISPPNSPSRRSGTLETIPESPVCGGVGASSAVSNGSRANSVSSRSATAPSTLQNHSVDKQMLPSAASSQPSTPPSAFALADLAQTVHEANELRLERAASASSIGVVRTMRRNGTQATWSNGQLGSQAAPTTSVTSLPTSRSTPILVLQPAANGQGPLIPKVSGGCTPNSHSPARPASPTATNSSMHIALARQPPHNAGTQGIGAGYPASAACSRSSVSHGLLTPLRNHSPPPSVRSATIHPLIPALDAVTVSNLRTVGSRPMTPSRDSGGSSGGRSPARATSPSTLAGQLASASGLSGGCAPSSQQLLGFRGPAPPVQAVPKGCWRP